MRRRELERLLYEWQAALGLADWEIELFSPTAEEMEGDDGSIDFFVPDRTAEIRIRRGIENQELVLVHELLHLWFATFAESRRNKVVEEQAIESISKCLVALKERAA